jgi:hypothetical protein
MNWTSAGEVGGNVARVEGGNVRVGWPGAPGWTTTGVAGSACWAETDSDNKHARAPAAKSRELESNHFIALISVSQWLEIRTKKQLLRHREEIKLGHRYGSPYHKAVGVLKR